MSFGSHQCQKCEYVFSKSCLLERHLESLTACDKNIKRSSQQKIQKVKINKSDKKIITYNCRYCGRIFSRNDALNRHLDNNCPILKNQHFLNQFEKIMKDSVEHVVKNSMEQIKEEMKDEMKEQVKAIMKNQIQNVVNNNVTNNLNVLCVRPNDSYLDILTQREGVDRAIEFIRGCALSGPNGDTKLLEKVYLNDQSSPRLTFTFRDLKRGRVDYIGEAGCLVIDVDGRRLSQILCNNIQKVYGDALDYLTKEPENEPNRKFSYKYLSQYDIEIWNNHINNLSNEKVQKKFMKSFASQWCDSIQNRKVN